MDGQGVAVCGERGARERQRALEQVGLGDVRGVEAPSCVVTAANYIRTHSRMSDVFLASDKDPEFLVAALTERPAFVALAFGYRAPDGFVERLGQINRQLNRMTTPDEVRTFFNQNNIVWYLRRTGAKLAWSDDVERFVVYRCESVRVYHFPAK